MRVNTCANRLRPWRQCLAPPSTWGWPVDCAGWRRISTPRRPRWSNTLLSRRSGKIRRRTKVQWRVLVAYVRKPLPLFLGSFAERRTAFAAAFLEILASPGRMTRSSDVRASAHGCNGTAPSASRCLQSNQERVVLPNVIFPQQRPEEKNKACFPGSCPLGWRNGAGFGHPLLDRPRGPLVLIHGACRQQGRS